MTGPPPAASSSCSSYVETPCTARTSGANCDAIRPFTSTIVRRPSAPTKNSMLNSDWSNPSAGISREAISAICCWGPAGSLLGYSNRRKLMPFACSTASVTPTGDTSPSCMKPSNVTRCPDSSSSAIRCRKLARRAAASTSASRSSLSTS